jgi:hypothetical protein
MATWKGYGIGRYNGRNRTERSSVIFKTSENGKLAFLNNKICIFEYEAVKMVTLMVKFGNGNNQLKIY